MENQDLDIVSRLQESSLVVEWQCGSTLKNVRYVPSYWHLLFVLVILSIFDHAYPTIRACAGGSRYEGPCH